MRKAVWLCWTISLTACVPGGTNVSSQSHALGGAVVTPQVVAPITDQTTVAFDVSQDGVTPSKDVPLVPGKRLNTVDDYQDLLLNVFSPTPYYVQRLTARTYFIELAFHSVTAFVGDSGVLLIDAPNVVPPLPPQNLLDGQRLMQAVQSFTNKPITRLIYSHPHQDHVGSAGFLKAALGGDFKIVGTKWLRKAIRRYNLPLPEPEIVIKSRVATYAFEDNPAFTFRIVTPEPAAHTTADSYIITPDRVLHVVDIIHARRFPFVGNSVVMNEEGWIRMLRYLAGEQANYDFINPGHENIAYFDDVQLTTDHAIALYNKWWELTLAHDAQNNFPNQFFAFLTVPINGQPVLQHQSIVWLRNWFDAMAERMMIGGPLVPSGILQDNPFFNTVPNIEAGRDHAAKVHEDLFLNRFSPTNAPNIPSFAPLPPPASCADLPDEDDC
jgi:glyoxylase-like metal-dependent hydrolase (beta-lactamase superfamily II)